MDFGTQIRYPPNAFQPFYQTDPRHDPRDYAAAGGARLRGGPGREDNANMDGGQSRRRIAVACARCRKRKIRCSGDPGNGQRCSNCKSAGVDPGLCQFHRVGSNTPAKVFEQQEYHRHHDPRFFVNNLTTLANPHGMLCSTTGGRLYSRAVPYHQQATGTVCQPAWSIPYSEETSPVETYSLDQPGAYLPDQNTVSAMNEYGESCRWHHTARKASYGRANAYSDPQPVSVYGGNPYVQASIRAVGTSEAHSSMNMTSLQQTLPERSQPLPVQLSEATLPMRQLPIPQPSSAQSLRNVVDQLQAQRLRTAPILETPAFSVFPKLGLPFGGDADVPNAAMVGTSSADLETKSTTLELPATAPDEEVKYPSVHPSTSEEAAPPISTPPSELNFTTAFLDAIPLKTISTPYSNFRSYDLPTSTSAEALSLLVHQNSASSYSFSPNGSSKGACGRDELGNTALVSGHSYTPLGQKQRESQLQARVDGLPRDSLNGRGIPVRRGPAPGLSQIY